MMTRKNTAVSQAEELRALLGRATKAAAEKRHVAEAIQTLELQISQAHEGLQAARNRQDSEEFEAAQRERGSAVASDAARKAVAACELTLKTLQLKLRGMQPRVQEAEHRMEALAQDLEKLRAEVHLKKLAELREAFACALGRMESLVCQSLALSGHLGRQASGFHPDSLRDMVLASPFEASAVMKVFCVRRETGLSNLLKEWRNDPAAAEIDRELSQYDVSRSSGIAI